MQAGIEKSVVGMKYLSAVVPDCLLHQLIKQILACLQLEIACLRLKFEKVENLLGVLTKYTIWDFVD